MQSWKNIIQEEQKLPYYIQLMEYINEQYKFHAVYPPHNMIFNAFKLTEYEDVKVVILGQDPYHGEGQANGLAFSVNEGVTPPPSLKNIFKEIGCDTKNGDLTYLAKQGVLLLNSVLTVRKGEPNSHKDIGWEIFTQRIIKCLNHRDTPIVFLLWGNYAKKMKQLITNKSHLILTSVHPSPLSANYGFFGCNHFKLANDFLEKNNLIPISWSN